MSVQLFLFKPGQLEVKAGSKVTWANQDDIGHTVTSGTPGQRDGRFDLALEAKGTTATVQLTDDRRSPGRSHRPAVPRRFLARGQVLHSDIFITGWR